MRTKTALSRAWYFWPVLIFRVSFAVIQRLLILFLLMGVGFFAITINDQGQDMLRTFQTRSIFSGFGYLIWFYCYLIVWASLLWYAARLLLSAANFRKLVERPQPLHALPQHDGVSIPVPASLMLYIKDVDYERAVNWVQAWLPRVLLLAPYLIFFLGHQAILEPGSRIYPFNFYLALLLGVVHLLIQVFRVPLADRMQHWWRKERKRSVVHARFVVEPSETVIGSIRRARVKTYTWMMLVVTLTMIFHVVVLMRTTPGFAGKPGLVIITALSVFTFVAILVHLVSNRLRFPIFTLALGSAFLVFGRWNNNHHIQVIDRSEAGFISDSVRVMDTVYADRWLDHFLIASDTIQRDTIYMIAAEGGGIRNCYWTYRVLHEMQQRIPRFQERTFAATGVSGGSIGIGFYYNYLRLAPALSDSAQYLSRICGADYLTGVTYGLLFPDLLQRFIPVAIPSWDRARYLINDFDRAFTAQLMLARKDAGLPHDTSMYLSQNYLAPWYSPRATDSSYRTPVLLFNTVVNDIGVKGVFSPFKLSPLFYPDVVDLLGMFQVDVPMKEAMGSSARFPLLTPPGLIRSRKERAAMHQVSISDGGIFENTGIQTMQSTARMLQSRLDKRGAKNIHIALVYIGTGVNDINQQATVRDYIAPAGTTGFGLSFLDGMLNSLFRWIRGVYLTRSNAGFEWPVTKYGLDVRPDNKNKYLLPLGWYLSDSSRAEIERQAWIRVKQVR